MALFRRILSPREQPQILSDPDGGESVDKSVVERRSKNNPKGTSDNNHKQQQQQQHHHHHHHHHRRTNSFGDGSRLVEVAEPTGFSLLSTPPQLPPRNLDPTGTHQQQQQHFSTGLGYRRTQSSGSTVMLRHQAPPERSNDADTATYFNPADTLNALNGKVPGTHAAERSPGGGGCTTQTLHEARNQQMFEKIMAHNNPVQRPNNVRGPSAEALTDRSEYSVPFQAPESSTQAPSKRSRLRHSINTPKVEPHGRRLSHPPNFAPPPPPSSSTSASSPAEGHERLSSVSPISPSSQNADYDSPWNSEKFGLHRLRHGSGRHRADSTPQAITHGVPPPPTTPPSGVTPPPSCLEERLGSNTHPDRHHKTAEMDSSKKSPSQRQTHQTWPIPSNDIEAVNNKPSNSSPLPPLPPRNPPPDHVPPKIPGESGNPVLGTGFSSVKDDLMHEYVIPPDAGFDDLVHDYVIPPDATSSSSQDSMHEVVPVNNKKGHRYPPLLPGSNISPAYMYPPDPRFPPPPPAYLINTHLSLENQPWYHGNITRDQAEAVLKDQADFSFLVRKSETQRTDFSLSIRDKTSLLANGYVHLRISRSQEGNGYVLGQFSSTFNNVSECIAFYTHHQLTIKDIKHRRLGFPVSRW